MDSLDRNETAALIQKYGGRVTPTLTLTLTLTPTPTPTLTLPLTLPLTLTQLPEYDELGYISSCKEGHYYLEVCGYP